MSSKPFILFVLSILFLASCAPKSSSPTPEPTQSAAIQTSLETQISTPTPLPEIEVGVVVVNSLNIRQGPGVNFPTLGSLKQGDKFAILGDTVNATSHKWLLISLPDGSYGWVTGDRSYVTIQRESVDAGTYSNWQRSLQAAKAAEVIPVTGP